MSKEELKQCLKEMIKSGEIKLEVSHSDYCGTCTRIYIDDEQVFYKLRN